MVAFNKLLSSHGFSTGFVHIARVTSEKTQTFGIFCPDVSCKFSRWLSQFE